MKRALIIGVNYYNRDYEELAKKMYEHLLYDEKILLTKDATPSRIISDLRDIVRRSSHSDVVLLYFSGHCESMYKNHFAVAGDMLDVRIMMSTMLNTTKRIKFQIILDCNSGDSVIDLPYHIHKQGHIETGSECNNDVLLVHSKNNVGSLTNTLLQLPHKIPANILCNAECEPHVAASQLKNLLVYI